jgi:hypothetical protein
MFGEAGSTPCDGIFGGVRPADTFDGVARRRLRWEPRPVIWGTAVVVIVAIVAGGAAFWSLRGGQPRTPSLCRVTVGSPSYVIDPEQAANATTITVVGKQLGMPDHAVTIALATALQESKLHNLPYGDRDSLGLFQQRPSQGWGTPAQLMNPRYAATAFFNALARVPGWQTSSVTDAAQAVQHSNAPEAYAVSEPLARALAIATTGERPSGLTCEFPLTRSPTPPASPIPAMTRLLGPSALGTTVSPARGWMIASWLVGHAEQYRITSVRFGAREWTPRGTWTQIRATGTGVQITQMGADAG